MADESHGQMLIQQQQPPSQQPQLQQSQMQQPQLQPSQMQQPQLQQSQMQQPQLQPSQMQQQSQLQQSQLQQSQLQQSQLQQSQLQQSQLQQSQLQQSQLQQSQLQQSQLQQSQMQQTQLQQSQLQQSQLQQQSQQLQQSQLSQMQQQQSQLQQQQQSQQLQNMAVDQHTGLNVATSVPLSVVSVSQSQQMQAIQQGVNTSSGNPVQMAQLAAQGQQQLTAATMMSQSSGPHPTIMHPTMTMAQAPLQQVQVIQNPGSYLQHLYNPQMIFPAGNLTLQHQLGGAQGLSLQLQAKQDPKNPNAQAQGNKQAMAVNTGTMMTASGQVIGTGPKGNFPQQMMSGPGKGTIIHGQPGFAPTNTNQTVVIGQLGVMPNQQSIFNHKAIADSQKGKFTFQSPATLQPKSLYSSPVSSGQVFKQMSNQPQIITTQATPGSMFSQTQLLGLQMPHGLSWAAAPGSFQSLGLGQNPIFISRQQSDMFIQQSQPQQALQHLSQQHQQQQTPQLPFAPSPIAPSMKQKQVRMRPGTHSVAVGTQTQVSNATTMHSNTAPVRTQIKPKVRATTGPSPGPPPPPQMTSMQTQTQTQTQTQMQTQQQPTPIQHQPPLNPKLSDAGNQTTIRTAPEPAKPQQLLVPGKPLPVLPETAAKPVAPPPQQATVAPSAKVTQQTETATVGPVAVVTSESPPPVVKTPPPPHQSEGGVLKPQQPIGQQVKDKVPPQKAIVKPQVLTHIIDGLVIQEGSEPFPVSRSALLDSPGRILASEKLDSQLKRKDSTTVASPDKRLKAHRGNVELAKCEYCGKLGPKSKFKRSKRFCSNSCAKRFNVVEKGRAKGANLEAPGPGRKKKAGGFRGRKGSTKEAEMEEMETSQLQDAEVIQLEEEEEASVDDPDPIEEEDNLKPDKEGGFAQKLATKWSVQDVFEFVQSLPGCCDYADTFRMQEIDGQALLLLKEDHLMASMAMKLGPALKLISHVRGIKEEMEQAA